MTENSTSEPKQNTVLKSWGLVIVVLTLVPLAYGFFYFQDRSSYLTNHYFRSLSGIEKQINQGLKGMDFLLDFAVVEDNLNLDQAFKDEFCGEDKDKPNYCQEYKTYLKKYSSSFHNIKFDQKNKSCIASSAKDTERVKNKEKDITCFSITGSFDNKKITVFDEKIILEKEIEKRLTSKKRKKETDATFIEYGEEKKKKEIKTNIKTDTDKKKTETTQELENFIDEHDLLSSAKTAYTSEQEKSAQILKDSFSIKQRKILQDKVTKKLVNQEIQDLISKKAEDLKPPVRLQRKNETQPAQPITAPSRQFSTKEIKQLVDDERKVLTVTVPIKDLIDPLPALQYFNRILLLNRAGNIVYRSGSDDLSRTANISAFDDFIRFENLSEYLSSGLEKKLEMQGKEISFKEVAQITSHSRVRKATIAGISYSLYIQPFHAVRKQNFDQPDTNNNASEKTSAQKLNPDQLAFIVGIIPTEKNNKAIMSLPLGRINILFFAILFILLLTPHLKLFFSGPRFMPNRAFVVWLAVSFPLMTMVLILGALSAYDYFQLKQSLDNTAKQIGSKISANFKQEFGQLNKVLRPEFFLQHGIEHDLKADQSSSDNLNMLPKNPNLPMYKFKQLTDLSEVMLAQPALEFPKKYPIFESAFYLNSEGELTGKQLSYRSFPTISIKVNRRKYFKQSYYHPERLSIWPPDNLEYFSERIETYDHGIKLTALSFPVSTKFNACDDGCEESKNKPPKVLAIIKLMHSFFQPVMPAGFGFAVIKDSSGEVLYHSNDQRSLLENFYIETDENRRIIAAAQMRHEHLINGNYNGRTHNFWITPLENTPWSLVVFYDTELMELANIKTSIFSVGFSFMMIICLLLLVGFCYCTKKTILLKLVVNLPNRISWRSIKKKYRLSFSKFSKLYTLINSYWLILIFGLIATIWFSHFHDMQVKKIAKYNLFHIGSSLLERQVALTTEINRVTKLNNNILEKTRYLNMNLFHFSHYTQAIQDDGAGATRSPWFAYYSKQPNIDCNYSENEAIESFEFLDEDMPIISRMDNRHQLLSHSKASDYSWCFDEASNLSLTAVFNDYTNSEFQLTSTGDYTKIQNVKTPLWWKLFLLIIPILLYSLVKLTSIRLLGLNYLEHEDLHNFISMYAPGHAVLKANKTKTWDTAKINFLTIAREDSEHFMELRSILFYLSHNHMINYTNTIPVMQLLESGILEQKQGMIFYRYQELKKWARHQPWDKTAKDYQVKDSSNLWSMLAMPFYSIIILAFIFLVISGGQVGELMLALIPIILTGGIPFISSFIGKRFGLD
ncbi:hypothetical protein [Methyloprofundus sp.]|uniref:hypothetical protein n=1 Tax=Methyloprofundus sp. TaxID=2020875 RepID=UPI003D09E677